MCMFRDLRADEIECRVAQAKQNGVSLLLYKDARCDQNILDETVGAMNWQRQHVRDNANCIVSIWDDKKQQWIGKEDTGKESNTEAEKGLASDSFKRACFNWGIGRELYTAPFIWIKAEDCTALKARSDGKTWQCFDSFEVENIVIENKRIIAITIKNTRSGKRCFVWQDENPKKNKAQEPETVKCECCGKEIKPYQNGKGTVTVERHCKASIERFGKQLCLNCIDGLKIKEG